MFRFHQFLIVLALVGFLAFASAQEEIEGVEERQWEQGDLAVVPIRMSVEDEETGILVGFVGEQRASSSDESFPLEPSDDEPFEPYESDEELDIFLMNENDELSLLEEEIVQIFDMFLELTEEMANLSFDESVSSETDLLSPVEIDIEIDESSESIIAQTYPPSSWIYKACGGFKGPYETLCLLDLVDKMQQALVQTDNEVDSLAQEVELLTDASEFALQKLEVCVVSLWNERLYADQQHAIAQRLDNWLFYLLISFGFMLCLYCSWKLGKACAQRDQHNHPQPQHEIPYVPAHPYEAL